MYTGGAPRVHENVVKLHMSAVEGQIVCVFLRGENQHCYDELKVSLSGPSRLQCRLCKLLALSFDCLFVCRLSLSHDVVQRRDRRASGGRVSVDW